MEYRADDKHVREILKAFMLEEGSKGLDLPIVKDAGVEETDLDGLLDKQEATRFRAVAARANYLALDRPDIQYATKEICSVQS